MGPEELQNMCTSIR